MSKRRPWAWLLLAMIALTCVLIQPAAAHAATSNTLSVHLAHDGTVVPNVRTKVYLVASKDASTDDYTYVDPFADSHVDLPRGTEGGKASDWDSAARQLAGYVSDRGVGQTVAGTTDGNGDVTFSGLSEGLYLVVSDSGTIDGTTYSFSPYLINLPGVDASGKVVSSVTSAPKSSAEQPPQPHVPTSPSPNPPTPTPTPQNLAQTGDAWLPIIPIAIAGIALVVVGWKLHNRKDTQGTYGSASTD